MTLSCALTCPQLVRRFICRSNNEVQVWLDVMWSAATQHVIGHVNAVVSFEQFRCWHHLLSCALYMAPDQAASSAAAEYEYNHDRFRR